MYLRYEIITLILIIKIETTNNAICTCAGKTHRHISMAFSPLSLSVSLPVGSTAVYFIYVFLSLKDWFILEHCGKLSSSGKNEIYDSILTMCLYVHLAGMPVFPLMLSLFFLCASYCIVLHCIAIMPYYFLVVQNFTSSKIAQATIFTFQNCVCLVLPIYIYCHRKLCTKRCVKITVLWLSNVYKTVNKQI